MLSERISSFRFIYIYKKFRNVFDYYIGIDLFSFHDNLLQNKKIFKRQ